MKRDCRKTSHRVALQQNSWGDLGRVHTRMPVLLGRAMIRPFEKMANLGLPCPSSEFPPTPHREPVMLSFCLFWPGSLKTSCHSEPATIDPLCSSTCSWPTSCPSLFTITKLNSLPLGEAYTAASNRRMYKFFYPRRRRQAITLTEVHWDLAGFSGPLLIYISEGLFNIEAQRDF